VVVGGHLVYGLNVQAGVGYRNDVTKGVPTGAEEPHDEGAMVAGIARIGAAVTVAEVDWRLP